MPAARGGADGHGAQQGVWDAGTSVPERCRCLSHAAMLSMRAYRCQQRAGIRLAQRFSCDAAHGRRQTLLIDFAVYDEPSQGSYA
jgi:hypothetical protein